MHVKDERCVYRQTAEAPTAPSGMSREREQEERSLRTSKAPVHRRTEPSELLAAALRMT